MDYLGYSAEELDRMGGYNTAREISGQPELWEWVYRKVMREKGEIIDYFDRFLEEEDPCIVLTGAGTSGYIGEILEGVFQEELGIFCRAVPTTDLITHPEHYFIMEKATMLISFARSGNSPESLYAIQLGEEYCSRFYEVNITCNKEGELAKRGEGGTRFLFLLSEESNDKSLAMTGSFSSMLLVGLLLMRVRTIESLGPVIRVIIEMSRFILERYLILLKNISGYDFNRVVFLGSGPLYGVAREAHLKVQELSNGTVICKYDSYLGFRHGPKAIVNDSTLMVYLLSNDRHVNLYETDLIESVLSTGAGELSLAIGSGYARERISFDFSIDFPEELLQEAVPVEFLSLPYVIPAQLLGFFKSVSLGLSPDSPSLNHAITRVVQGVNIYKR